MTERCTVPVGREPKAGILFRIKPPEKPDLSLYKSLGVDLRETSGACWEVACTSRHVLERQGAGAAAFESVESSGIESLVEERLGVAIWAKNSYGETV